MFVWFTRGNLRTNVKKIAQILLEENKFLINISGHIAQKLETWVLLVQRIDTLSTCLTNIFLSFLILEILGLSETHGVQTYHKPSGNISQNILENVITLLSFLYILVPPFNINYLKSVVLHHLNIFQPFRRHYLFTVLYCSVFNLV